MPTLTTLTIDPASASIVAGDTAAFTVTALDETDAPMVPFPALVLHTSDNSKVSLTNVDGAVTATARLLGAATISVSSGAVQSNTAAVLVVAADAALASLVIGPDEVPIDSLTTGVAGVQALDQFGKPFTIPGLTFFTSNAGVAAISGAVGSVLTITPAGAGQCLVWCSDGGSIVSNKIRVAVYVASAGPGRFGRFARGRRR